MNNHYHHLVFGPDAIARQRDSGTFVAYGAAMERGDDGPDVLGSREINLITNAFQCHVATVSTAGWPYVQYRSGPTGFIHHLGDSRIAFADHHGNGQFVSAGNIDSNGKIALFFADHPRRIRLKVFGMAKIIDIDADPTLLETLAHTPAGRITATHERAIVIDVHAFDWNCSRSIVPLYTRDYIRELNISHAAALAERDAEIAALRQRLSDLSGES